MEQADERSPFSHGPFVTVACFCDQVIEGKDGVLSLIRVIDRLDTTAQGPAELSPEMPPYPWKGFVVLSIKSGIVSGRHTIKVVPVDPGRAPGNPIMLDAQLEGGNKGFNIILQTAYTFTKEGVYWFEVYFDDKLWTQMPFEVSYRRIVMSTSRRPPGPQ